MTKFKKFAIGFTAAIAGIAVCMGASYIQAKLSPVVERPEPRQSRVLTSEESARADELMDKRSYVALKTISMEEMVKARDNLAKKKHPSDCDIELINGYNSLIEKYEKELSKMPTYDELQAQIDAILYY